MKDKVIIRCGINGSHFKTPSDRSNVYVDLDGYDAERALHDCRMAALLGSSVGGVGVEETLVTGAGGSTKVVTGKQAAAVRHFALRRDDTRKHLEREFRLSDECEDEGQRTFHTLSKNEEALVGVLEAAAARAQAQPEDAGTNTSPTPADRAVALPSVKEGFGQLRG